MLRKLGTVLLWAIAAFMLSSVTIFNPGQVTDWFIRIFNIQQTVPTLRPLEISERDRQIRAVADAVSEADLRATVERLASVPSRLVGYPGHEEAFRYVSEQFEQIGLEEVRVESFPVTVPVDKGARLRVSGTGQEVPLYGLWPNQVRTPTLPKGGATGPLIYGGKGEFRDFNGKKVDGSVVLLDFGSGQSYINARMLGAKAILFFDNSGGGRDLMGASGGGEVNQGQASDKFLRVPADIPRYWVRKEDAPALLQLAGTGAEVTVEGRMDWEEVQAKNIYGVLRGADAPIDAQGDRRWKDQIIVLSAFYDAASVVPALAPGAENAAGLAALLQAARALKKERPKYTVLFLATSGHFQGMAGVNDFLYRHARVSDHFRELIPDRDKIDFKLFIGLDLSSESDQIASFSHATFYNSNWQTNNYQNNLLAPYAKKFTDYLHRVYPGTADSLRHIDAIAPPKRTWKNYMPIRLGFDSEAVTFVGKEGITLATPSTVRDLVDTPNDLPDRVNYANLTRQTRSIVAALLKAVEDPDFFRVSKLVLQDLGHSLKGRILWFRRDVDFAIPRVPVPGAVVAYQQPGPTNSVGGVRTLIVTKATTGPIYVRQDPAQTGPEYGTGQEVERAGRFSFPIVRNRFSNQILAYELDPESGDILSAPDMGNEGNGSFPIEQRYGWWENEMMEVLFKCRAISIFEIVDSSYLSALDYMTILGANDTQPQWYGYSYVPNQSRQENNITRAAVAFGRPGDRLKVLMSTGIFGIKYLLINAPEDLLLNPVSPAQVDEAALDRAMGVGYPTAQSFISMPSYQAARDMWVIDDARMKQLARYGVSNQRLSRLHEEARGALLDARKHLDALDYEQFVAAARQAWGLEARGYPEVKETANDTVRGIIFYFILLLPFSMFCERLIFGFPDILRRLLGFAGFFILLFIVLRFVHPAFKLSSSPYIIFLAFVIMAMGAVAMVIVISKFGDEVKKMKRASSGVHEADVGRISATAAAITLGISNLRKRPLRTWLTAATLTLLTFTVLSFTSVQTALKFYKLPRDNKPSYPGGLIRDRAWRGLQESVLSYVQSAFAGKATMAPRAWYMSQVKGERAYIDFERVSEGSRQAPAGMNYLDFDIGVTTGTSSFVNAILGLTSQETEVTHADKHLLSGRWFRPGEREVCILPNDLAELVGIYPEDAGKARIRALGKEFTVIGVLNSDEFNKYKDIDDEKLTPVDTVKEKDQLSEQADQDPRVVAAAPIESFTHLESTNVLLLPYETVRGIEGQLVSIAVTNFRDADGNPKADFLTDIEDFMSRVSLTMFVSYNDKVVVYSSIGSTSISGLGNLFIPIVIAALIVLNTMMGAVYERFREIGIYSSVGLAPSHIGALFLAEAAVFATLGAVLGYLIGQTMVLFLSMAGQLGGMSLNYSSLSAVSSTLIVMVTVFLSTLYPAKKASDMAVPDVTRKWEFPEPDGDRWVFDFPFTVGGAEVLGMYTYLTRVFESYGEGSVGDFVADNVHFTSTDLAGEPQYEISMTTWLAPYDLGISQDVRLLAIPTGEYNIYRIEVTIFRLSGDVASWKRINRGFLNVLRKRFLVWRTVPPELKADYAAQGRRQLAGEAVTA